MLKVMLFLAIALLSASQLAQATPDYRDPLHPGDFRLDPANLGAITGFQAAFQGNQAHDASGIIRVSYQSRGSAPRGSDCFLVAGNTWCGSHFYRVRGEMTFGTAETTPSHFAFQYDPYVVQQGNADHSRIFEYGFGRIVASREVWLGEELKVRVDAFDVSATFQNAPGSSEFLRLFMTANAHALGIQHLLASGAATSDARNLLGLTLGRAFVEVGAQQNWSESFRSRITLGGAVSSAELFELGADSVTARNIVEANAYMRVSAMFNTGVDDEDNGNAPAIELYTQFMARTQQSPGGDILSSPSRLNVEVGGALQF